MSETVVVSTEPLASNPEQVATQNVEAEKANAEARVEVAEVEAERDVKIAEVGAEVAAQAIEAEQNRVTENMEARIGQCQLNIGTMGAEIAELKQGQQLILKQLETINPPSPPSDGAAPQDQKTEPKEPVVKKRRLRLI